MPDVEDAQWWMWVTAGRSVKSGLDCGEFLCGTWRITGANPPDRWREWRPPSRHDASLTLEQRLWLKPGETLHFTSEIIPTLVLYPIRRATGDRDRFMIYTFFPWGNVRFSWQTQITDVKSKTNWMTSLWIMKCVSVSSPSVCVFVTAMHFH